MSGRHQKPLSPEAQAKILKLYKAGYSRHVIAERFGVSIAYAADLLLRAKREEKEKTE